MKGMKVNKIITYQWIKHINTNQLQIKLRLQCVIVILQTPSKIYFFVQGIVKGEQNALTDAATYLRIRSVYR